MKPDPNNVITAFGENVEPQDDKAEDPKYIIEYNDDDNDLDDNPQINEDERSTKSPKPLSVTSGEPHEPYGPSITKGIMLPSEQAPTRKYNSSSASSSESYERFFYYFG